MAAVRVANLKDLREHVPLVVEVNGLELGIVLVNEKVHAFANSCAHQGGPVCRGRIYPKVEVVLGEQKEVLGERFSDRTFHLVCPWHGWEYDIETGRCSADPRWRIQKFEVEIRDGDIYILNL